MSPTRIKPIALVIACNPIDHALIEREAMKLHMEVDEFCELAIYLSIREGLVLPKGLWKCERRQTEKN